MANDCVTVKESMMEWSVDSTLDKRFVTVPDLLPHKIITAMDNPPGSFLLDPYRDYRFSSISLPEILDNLHKAIYDRRQINRQEVLERLHLKQWEEWACGALQSAENKDVLLVTLLKLEDLCSYALREGKDILIFGD
ncbi:hypothetical protein [Mastigocoleus sp. MO_188.B34]|uniref:hypothetical protein n=1 Tax=Mastigocoleus sp. MO_188.B34 TaxID=3036635 RepID=UPI0026266F92|nr:hypothetical protein [Mastigocoleus sp. MO_188.B34]MDJ0697872.1 hypothetical protein [Mastigocoleus sp. MO_188.B34]